MILLALLLACGEPQIEAASPVPPDTPVAMAELADRIAAAPAEADRILKEAGLDRSAFEARLYEIALDPEQSRAYSQARTR